MRSKNTIFKHLTFAVVPNVKIVLRNPANPREHWWKHLFLGLRPMNPHYDWSGGYFYEKFPFRLRGVSSFVEKN